jgi:DNA-directed RNA polymerase sigma subunit (sigma70/sigma32)
MGRSRMKIQSLTQEKISKFEKRNLEIFRLYSEEKRTLEAIGKDYDLTKQRVWQIVQRCLDGQGDYYAQHRQEN